MASETCLARVRPAEGWGIVVWRDLSRAGSSRKIVAPSAVALRYPFQNPEGRWVGGDSWQELWMAAQRVSDSEVWRVGTSSMSSIESQTRTSGWAWVPGQAYAVCGCFLAPPVYWAWLASASLAPPLSVWWSFGSKLAKRATELCIGWGFRCLVSSSGGSFNVPKSLWPLLRQQLLPT